MSSNNYADMQAVLRTTRQQNEQELLDLARLLRKRSRDIARWESGTSTPSVRNLVVWANALGYDVGLFRRNKTA